MTDHKPRDSKGRGRPKKTSETSHARVTALFNELSVGRRQRQELLSVLSSLFCTGSTGAEIKDEIQKQFPKYDSLLSGENLWDLLREAAEQQMFRHTPRHDIDLARLLEGRYSWLRGHLNVVQTAATEALAESAANKLLDMIRTVCRERDVDEVHVGFAGGMTLRTVAKKLADLLSEPHRDNPRTLVFHAMVASFFDDDFYADPNSFISYFIHRKCRVQVRLVRLPLPGIIETSQYETIRGLLGIEEVFQRRKEIQIVVTSGSLWSDKQSTLRTYLRAISEFRRKLQGVDFDSDEDDALPDSLINEFGNHNVIGDLLWQPINAEGPVEMKSKYQVTTLMGLDELPEFINNRGSVLLVMGCSGVSGIAKSVLLETILELHSTHPWITDVVTDTPTVEGIYYPNIREEYAALTENTKRIRKGKAKHPRKAR